MKPNLHLAFIAIASLGAVPVIAQTSASATGQIATPSSATDAKIAELQAAGFTRIEVKNGPTQSKIEAIRGQEKVEMVIDQTTGATLKEENERVGLFANRQAGVEVRDRNRDFVTVGASDNDDDHHKSRLSSKGQRHLEVEDEREDEQDDDSDDDTHDGDHDSEDDGDDDSDGDGGHDSNHNGDDDGDHDSGDDDGDDDGGSDSDD